MYTVLCGRKASEKTTRPLFFNFAKAQYFRLDTQKYDIINVN